MVFSCYLILTYLDELNCFQEKKNIIDYFTTTGHCENHIEKFYAILNYKKLNH